MFHRGKQSRIHQIVIGATLLAITLLLVSILLHWAWNSVVPDIFGLSELSFKNSLGLVLIGSIVIGSVKHLVGGSDCRRGGGNGEESSAS